MSSKPTLEELQQEAKDRHALLNKIPPVVDQEDLFFIRKKHRLRMKKEEFDAPKAVIVRPKAEYSNTPTPFGIASELHHGDTLKR